MRVCLSDALCGKWNVKRHTCMQSAAADLHAPTSVYLVRSARADISKRNHSIITGFRCIPIALLWHPDWL